MTKLCGVKMTDGERQLLGWLTRRYGLSSGSDTIRHLVHLAARLEGAPPALRATAREERQQHPPRKAGAEMIEVDELAQRVIDLSGKDGGK